MAGRSPAGPVLSRAASSSAPAQDNAFKLEYFLALLIGQSVDVLMLDGDVISGVVKSLKEDILILGYPLRKVSAAKPRNVFSAHFDEMRPHKRCSALASLLLS